jgi:hypothetical protein
MVSSYNLVISAKSSIVFNLAFVLALLTTPSKSYRSKSPEVLIV